MTYAVGEIFLVVIGILIALQINTWNTERNNRIKEREYLNFLAKELGRDIEFFTEKKNGFKNKEAALKRLIKKWQKDTLFITDSLQYIQDFRTAGNGSPWYSEPVTWTQLVQTGDLKLIQNQQFINALFSYYSLVKRASDNYSFHPMDNLKKIRALNARPWLKEDPDIAVALVLEKPPDKYVFDWIWANRYDYMELFLSAAIISSLQQRYLQSIIDEGKMVLELIESE